MRLLLDTHVLLWWLADDAALPSAFRDVIADPGNDVLVSAVSLGEVAIKASLGKLRIPEEFWDAVDSSGFEALPFGGHHARELLTLPWHHRDPFDRMLIAQARVEQLRLASVDAACRRYDVLLLG
ncbi:MAG: type II toxin-antitoxin system VapC family toxin [Microbacteriaceae bacterium]